MWRIHRHYLKELAVTSMVTFLVLFGIVLIASLSRGISRAQGASLVSAMLITFYWAADTFPHLLAISLLVSTVLTFARASQDREITAIRAAGISPRVPMVAALIIGLICSIAGSLALHYLIPRAHYNKYRVVGEAVRNFVLNTKMSGGKIAFGGFFLSSERKDDRGHLHGVVIKVDRDDGGLEPGEAYYAREAWLDLGEDGETLRLSFLGIRNASGMYDLEGPVTLRVNIRNITDRGRRDTRDDDLTTDQLLADVYRGLHRHPEWALFQVHRRACYALMPCLLAPLGFCIGVLSRDRGRMTALLFAMVPALVFYACVLAAEEAMRQTGFSYIAWLPAAVLFVLGVPFCWRILKI